MQLIYFLLLRWNELNYLSIRFSPKKLKTLPKHTKVYRRFPLKNIA
jgi:hypothetical protein